MSPRPTSPTPGQESAPAVSTDETTASDERYLLEEDLVDEISIDGMCGVY
jgi:mycofactocin precursor